MAKSKTYGGGVAVVEMTPDCWYVSIVYRDRFVLSPVEKCDIPPPMYFGRYETEKHAIVAAALLNALLTVNDLFLESKGLS